LENLLGWSSLSSIFFLSAWKWTSSPDISRYKSLLIVVLVEHLAFRLISLKIKILFRR